MEARRWYVVQTYSGFENSVKEDLERRIQSMGMEEQIFTVMIPEEVVVETKADGTKKEKVKKMFPGYVFVEMIVTDESWFIVRNTQKVTGFLGSSGGGTKPVPLPTEEINLILKKVGMMEPLKLDFEVGDRVDIVNGTMKGQIGEVSEINVEKGTVSVLIEMFGRHVPVDLEITDVKKIR